MDVLILLSTYNGEKYIREQIDSLINQTVPVKILVRDDGSSDRTCDILEEYKAQGQLDWYTGDNLKPAKSFWNLVWNAPKADFYAFCDQDDFWYKDKIEKAIDGINALVNQKQPILYCSNVTVADSVLNPISNMVNGGKVYTDFPHSLVYSLAPGCTFVFNDRARAEFIKYDMNSNFEIIHDWLAHKIVAMLGTVIFDPQPSMLYRQHGNNVIGAQGKGFKTFCNRVHRMVTSSESVRSKSAQSLLNVFSDQISDTEEIYLKMVGFYKSDKKLKREFLKNKAFRTNALNNFFLKCLIRLKKV